MAKQTKTLKQTNYPDVKIRQFGNGTLIVKQNLCQIIVQTKHFPELIELLKSELEGSNNG